MTPFPLENISNDTNCLIHPGEGPKEEGENELYGTCEMNLNSKPKKKNWRQYNQRHQMIDERFGRQDEEG